MNAAYSQTNPMARVMSLRNFRLLFTGAFISLLGDQFALIPYLKGFSESLVTAKSEG